MTQSKPAITEANNAAIIKTRDDLNADLIEAIRDRLPGGAIQQIAADLVKIRAICRSQGLPAW